MTDLKSDDLLLIRRRRIDRAMDKNDYLRDRRHIDTSLVFVMEYILADKDRTELYLALFSEPTYHYPLPGDGEDVDL